MSAMAMEAANDIAEDGVKVTEMEHFAPAASVDPQVLALMAKSEGLVPVMLIGEVMLRVALPGFESTVVRAAEV